MGKWAKWKMMMLMMFFQQEDKQAEMVSKGGMLKASVSGHP